MNGREPRTVAALRQPIDFLEVCGDPSHADPIVSPDTIHLGVGTPIKVYMIRHMVFAHGFFLLYLSDFVFNFALSRRFLLFFPSVKCYTVCRANFPLTFPLASISCTLPLRIVYIMYFLEFVNAHGSFCLPAGPF